MVLMGHPQIGWKLTSILMQHDILLDGIGNIDIVERPSVDPALKVVNAARTSYSNTSEIMTDKDKKLVGYLWEHGHTSPFRHSYYTFVIKAPLFVMRQWMKYQVGSTWREYEVEGQTTSLEVFDLFYDLDKGCSWNEVSGRYTVLKPEFYIPSTMRANAPHGNKQKSVSLPYDFPHEKHRLDMMKQCEEAYKVYEQRIESGIAKEMARMFLPQNIYTTSYWTVSLQSIIHFLAQRLDGDAQYEIRKYAEAIYNEIKNDLSRMGISKEDLKYE